MRGTSLTVDELARSLGLTDNAVRAHLTALERDGILKQEGTRKGVAGKPAALYGLAPDISVLFSRAYAPLLSAIVAELGSRLSASERRDVLRAAGRRLAADHVRPAGPLRERLDIVAALLTELGGAASVESSGDRWVIAGQGCPLASAVRQDTEVCSAVGALVSEMIGHAVEERCVHGGREPSCRFEVLKAAG
jgi:predicted ArsR family transcriptional regulator